MKARITANKKFIIDRIDRRIYGSFIEHLGRAVYHGIYEPTHPEADTMGFRKDVLELVRKLRIPIVRYPGGNFVSGYRWEDGIGDKSKRPHRMELAWSAIETNEVGIDEFQEWAKRADTEIMMAVNLGTRGAEEARNCVEYCNASTDTYYANLRRKNGFDQPFGIKLWCLGNEMDGPWQMGRKTALEYARVAVESAKLMKMTDPSIELVACGSSNLQMPTFGDWELTVLDHAYNYIDYISLHTYYGNQNQDAAAFFGRSEEMDAFIKGVSACCDAIKAKKHSSKQINLSFDEWNVWFHSNESDKKLEKWQIAPPQLEDRYDFADAIVIGCMLMTLQNNCDRVKIACLAQLVNVIAPIMTENNGKSWVQTIFYPFLYASLYGNGLTLRTITECPDYTTSEGKAVPYLASSVIYNDASEEIAVFAVNRSLEDDIELELDLDGFDGYEPIEQIELYCDDLYAVNEKDVERVSPSEVKFEKNAPIILKKHSWNMIRLAKRS